MDRELQDAYGEIHSPDELSQVHMEYLHRPTKRFRKSVRNNIRRRIAIRNNMRYKRWMENKYWSWWGEKADKRIPPSGTAGGPRPKGAAATKSYEGPRETSIRRQSGSKQTHGRRNKGQRTRRGKRSGHARDARRVKRKEARKKTGVCIEN